VIAESGICVGAMRIRIAHETVYRYDSPAAAAIQVLRLTPRNHHGQYVIDWRIEVSRECRLHAHEDAFGNLSHAFTLAGPFDELTLAAEGEVDTSDMNGIVAGAIERFPPTLFLRETPLTARDPAAVEFAQDVRAEAGSEPLTVLHALLVGVHRTMRLDPETGEPGRTAAEALIAGRGSASDQAHVFIAAARTLGIPARYVRGYFHDFAARSSADARHAWAEAFVPALGWVGFDPAHGICPTDCHVRVAVGLDHLGAAAVRGSHHGGGPEARTDRVRVLQALRQMQD
jgi:transglutaminase-like putative cysteine protease